MAGLVILRRSIKIICMINTYCRRLITLISFITLIFLLLISCVQQKEHIVGLISETITEVAPAKETEAPESLPSLMANTTEPNFSDSIYIQNSLPEMILHSVIGFPISDALNDNLTVFRLSNDQYEGETILWHGDWVYAAVTAFPYNQDSIDSDELFHLWTGDCEESCRFDSLFMTQNTHDLFSALWKDSGNSVFIVDAVQITDLLWGDTNRIALIPFEEIEPRQKVLSVDDINPLNKGLDVTTYALALPFEAAFTGDVKFIDPKLKETIENLTVGNRDETKMTTVLLTGVTALVRGTGEKMVSNGVDYPQRDISGWLLDADITHISNEVPFYTSCLANGSAWSKSRFCSPIDFFDLFSIADIDVVELTGNHLLDYGIDAFLETLDLYETASIPFYGGGYNQEDARAPLIMENNGNHIAFLGCNVPGPANVFATADSPGAASCDMEWLLNEINRLKNDGFLVIVTFQHYESCQLIPMSGQRLDFNAAATIGADIVSGSQAHCAQSMTFIDNSFIHYGLGNLFFDQMWDDYRPEFLDAHTFYDNTYINTRLMTALLEDAAKPRPMSIIEREVFLAEMFAASGWIYE